MIKNCDKVLTVDDFDESFASWSGRSLTVMGEQIKVSQSGLNPRYFDTIYLYESTGLLVGFNYNGSIPECYITTKEGLEAGPFADAAPFLNIDNNHAFLTVKKQYRNVDLRRIVIGLNILCIPELELLYEKQTWPLWEGIESIQNGVIVIKKSDSNYAISTIDKFPACNVINNVIAVERDIDDDNICWVLTSTGKKNIDLSKFVKNKH